MAVKKEQVVVDLRPQAGKQEYAMNTLVDVMIFGGAAGCVDKDTQYLTESGWKYIKDYTDGELIYQYCPDKRNKLKLVEPSFSAYEMKDNFYRIENSRGISQTLSMEHRFVFFSKKKSKKEKEILVGDLIAYQQNSPLSGYIETTQGRVPFNIKGKKDTYLKIYEHIPEDGMKYCFETESSYVLFKNGEHIFVSGNSGKSRLLLLKALKYCYGDPNFGGVLFRRNTPSLKASGGLWPEAKKLYLPLKPKVREQAMEIEFMNPKGGLLKFTHLENESTAEASHQGTQYSMVGFDELTGFYQSQFLYLIGRLRSESATDSFCLGTCNPDADSWVLQWVLPYLDERGYPDQTQHGKILYYVINEDRPVFAEDYNELVEQYPDLCYNFNPITKKDELVIPNTFTYVSGNIYDNPALIKANPKYLANLKSQTAINRARLLDGCWFAKPEGSSHFQREWLNKTTYDKVPDKLKFIRGWDKASSEPSDKYRYPDYTASIKMGKSRDGDVFIFGDYDTDTIDPKTKVGGKFRKRAGDRDRLIAAQAHIDTAECLIILPKDPSGAGVVEYTESAKKLIQEGFRVKPDPMPSNKSKLTRFLPFSSACQNGFVYIVEDSFPNKETLESFYIELENFDGERSTTTKKDDWPDAAASTFNALMQEKVHTAVAIPDASSSKTLFGRSGLKY